MADLGYGGSRILRHLASEVKSDIGYSSSSSACPELERSGFHEVLPVFSILGASPSRVEAIIMRLEICCQGT